MVVFCIKLFLLSSQTILYAVCNTGYMALHHNCWFFSSNFVLVLRQPHVVFTHYVTSCYSLEGDLTPSKKGLLSPRKYLYRQHCLFTEGVLKISHKPAQCGKGLVGQVLPIFELSSNRFILNFENISFQVLKAWNIVYKYMKTSNQSEYSRALHLK